MISLSHKKWIYKTGAVLALWALMGGVGGCSGKPKVAQGDIAAIVNGEAVTRQELEGELKRLGFKTDDTSAPSRELQKGVLADLINKKLMLQQAAAKKLKVTDQELEQAVKEYSKDYTPEDFAQKQKESGLTPAAWRASLREELLIRKLEEEMLRQGGGISDQEALNYYQQHPQEFQREEQIRARHIMVKEPKEAQELLERLKQGADFAALAKERSQSADAKTGGDLGYVRRADMPEEFDAAFNLKAGQISGVIRSPYGYHIFKLEDKRKAYKKNFDEAAGEIKAKLARAKKEEAFESWMKEVKAKAEISVNPIYGMTAGEKK